MGQLDLTAFQDELDVVLGELSLAPADLTRWINFGYLDLAGAVDFSIMDADADIATVASTQTVAVPSGALFPLDVRDVTNDELLTWVPRGEILRKLVATESAPKFWTRIGDLIFFHPVPDAIYTVKVYYKDPPALFVNATDVSVFPDTYDVAILQLAAYHALLARGEEQRAANWLSTAIVYLRSRITEQDFQQEDLEESVGMRKLGERLASLQGA